MLVSDTVGALPAERPAIVRIEKTVMADLLHRAPGFARQFLARTLSRNNRMQADLVDHLFNSSESGSPGC